MEFVLIKSEEHFHKDVAAKGDPGGPHRHIGEPEKYPCLGVAHFSDDHMYWGFLYADSPVFIEFLNSATTTVAAARVRQGVVSSLKTAGEDLRRVTLTNPHLHISMEYDRETKTFTVWTPEVELKGSVS
jgi:hypothetical protein